jgi:Cu-Zn family superoxide dismutase
VINARLAAERRLDMTAKGSIVTVLGLILLSGSGGPTALLAGQNVLRATAVIQGAPGSGISGVVRFTQAPADQNLPEPGVWVVAQVHGLTPGLHGFHIHEVGLCEPPGFLTAGGHFDPGPFGHSTPVDANHPFHMGDLPNLVANPAGVGHLNTLTSRITLSPGPLSIFDVNGSAVIVHQNPDQGMTGAAGASGGPRMGCGVIELDSQ